MDAVEPREEQHRVRRATLETHRLKGHIAQVEHGLRSAEFEI